MVPQQVNGVTTAERAKQDKGQDKTLHIAINGWFVGNATAGSGQYIHHLLTHLPRLPKPLQLSLLLPPGTDTQGHDLAGISLEEVPVPPLPGPLRKLWRSS